MLRKYYRFWAAVFRIFPEASSGCHVFFSIFKEPYQAKCRIFLSLSLNFLPSSTNSFYVIKIPKSLFDCASSMLKNTYWLYNCLWNKIQTHLELKWLHGCDIIYILKPRPKSLWSEPDDVIWLYSLSMHICFFVSYHFMLVLQIRMILHLLLNFFKDKFNSQVLCSSLPDHSIQKRLLITLFAHKNLP